MKLGLKFGLNEPLREVNWWQPVKDFYPLVKYKNKKWEFAFYQEDPSKKVDYICTFGEIQSWDPAYYVDTYEDIERMFNTGYGPKCECGSIYTSFPQMHMFYCPRWRDLRDG